MIKNQEIITTNAKGTANLGFRMAKEFQIQKGSEVINAPVILCLYGDLGSGKTTFAGGFAKGLGLTTRLPSPTFIIVRRYDIPSSDFLLYHIDLYRLQSTVDTEKFGLEEIFADSKAYVLVEWAEHLGRVLPEKRLDLRFVSQQDGTHSIKIQKI